ncbi:hypothetical protein OPV22_013598 [Ensete ventricosum]|uniref:Uncharacterized protein n=1 Tax=Ensete ventricosum TaxID=4639 RepID=A0AAV8R9L9_ENSVE|nr:hypothetical protein OPV22_013598 [Ensete ventricosum]
MSKPFMFCSMSGKTCNQTTCGTLLRSRLFSLPPDAHPRHQCACCKMLVIAVATMAQHLHSEDSIQSPAVKPPGADRIDVLPSDFFTAKDLFFGAFEANDSV